MDERIEKLKGKTGLSIDEIKEILGSKKNLSINEMSYLLDEPKSTLRFWEDKYNLKIKRSKKNTAEAEKNVSKEKKPPRKYVAKDIVDLINIKFLCRTQKLTTHGVKNKLSRGKKVDNERTITEIVQKLRQELVDIQKKMNYQPTFTQSVLIE